MASFIRDDKLLQDRAERTSSYQKRVDPLKMTEMTPGLNVVLLGKTGAGKSSTGNTILGRQAFISKKSARPITRDVTVESGSFCELPLTVYDTPGLFDTELSDEEIQQMINEKVLQKCSSGLWVFLLVIKADRFTEDDRKTVEKIEKMLGENNKKNIWILFTGGDELEEENMTIQEFIEETEELKTLVQKYQHRYYVFNNKKKMKKEEEGPSEQVKMLFTKILKPHIDSMAGEEILNMNPVGKKIPEKSKPVSPVSGLPSRRIVLVGKSGVGKSAAGNTILRQKEFTSVMRMNSVTHQCSIAQADSVSGRSVSVVDTPGLFDTQMKPEELMMEIGRSVYFSSPGPHAFLIVFPVNMRFTEQELQIPQMIELMFGKEVLKYSIILFTHGDLLEEETVEKLIEENSRLRSVVQQCGGRYHVFNNRDVNNREQVEDLLQKIDSMIQQNGGEHYSNQMYEDAQRFRQEEEEERQRAEEERKQKVEKQIQEEIERVIKDIDEKFRPKIEAEKLKAKKQGEEEQRKLEKQKQDAIKEAEQRIRAEIKASLASTSSEQQNKVTYTEQFKQFYNKHFLFFWTCVGVVVGVTVGAAVGGIGGAIVGWKVGKCIAASATVGSVVGGAVVGVAGGAVGHVVAKKYDKKGREEEEKRKTEVEKQIQEQIEREIKEIEDRFRAEMEAEKLKAERQSEEEQRKLDKQKQEELDKAVKEKIAPLASASSEQRNYKIK